MIFCFRLSLLTYHLNRFYEYCPFDLDKEYAHNFYQEDGFPFIQEATFLVVMIYKNLANVFDVQQRFQRNPAHQEIRPLTMRVSTISWAD